MQPPETSGEVNRSQVLKKEWEEIIPQVKERSRTSCLRMLWMLKVHMA